MKTFTAVIHLEDNIYVADCPEVGTVGQGKNIEEAIEDLKEATELYLEETKNETPSPQVAFFPSIGDAVSPSQGEVSTC